MFTIVFLSLHSESHIKRLVSDIEKKYPIIVIENSSNYKLKEEIEKKYQNVKVIIPGKNIGFTAGYNLGIKESKTDYVFVNPSDVVLNKKCISELDECVSNIKDFTIIGPTYDNEKIYKNYEIWDAKKLNANISGKIFDKYKIKEVDFIDNDFIINKNHLTNSELFDENIFIYFDTMDFCRRVRALNKKIYVCDKIKFTHFGGQSHDPKYTFQASLNRNWHYNWSKFYYFKKNYSYLYAFKKSLPILVKLIFRYFSNLVFNKKRERDLIKAEFNGMIASVFLKKSSFRPFSKK